MLDPERVDNYSGSVLFRMHQRIFYYQLKTFVIA